MYSKTAAVLDVVRDSTPRYFVLDDGAILYGTLVPASPRSRSQFKVMTGKAGRPVVVTIARLYTWSHRKSDATIAAKEIARHGIHVSGHSKSK